MCEITDRLFRRKSEHTDQPSARRIPLSCNRTLVVDFLAHARQVPHFPVEKAFDLAELAALRQQSPRRISWTVLFLKAYALVAREHAVLRQSFLRWPWGHLIESNQNVGMVVVSREYLGEDRLCWAKFPQPETKSLVELQNRLDRFQADPVEKAFGVQVRASKLPAPIRKFALWWNVHFAGRLRANRLGTFTLSSLAGLGALNRQHPTVVTSSLTYGPLDQQGRSLVTILCDHRVIDGVAAASALTALEHALTGEIARELAGLRATTKAA